MDSVLRRNSGTLYDTAQANLKRRLEGAPSPGLADKFAQMDQATATGAAQARQDAIRPGMFGQGRASRSAGQVQQANMERISNDKLNQAQMLGVEQQGAENTAFSQRNSDRDFAYNAARDTGDAVTQAGMGRQSLSDQGVSYTGYGEGAMKQQAADVKANALRAAQREDQLFRMQDAQLQRSLQGGKDDKTGKWIQRAGQVADIASNFVPGGNVALGAVKGLSKLFG
jgi:hypothetical protein